MNIIRVLMILLILACSLLFLACLGSIANREKSLAIHKEMPSTASNVLLTVKNLVTIITGLFFLITLVGVIFNLRLPLAFGVCGACLFIAFYIVEIFLWGKTYPQVWGGFAMFGTVCAVIGSYCLVLLNKK